MADLLKIERIARRRLLQWLPWAAAAGKLRADDPPCQANAKGESSLCEGQSAAARRWDFNQWPDSEGWQFSPGLTGTVLGGALWLRLAPFSVPLPTVSAAHYQIYGNAGAEQRPYELASPAHLGIACQTVKKIRFRLINLSPVTDAYLLWTTSEQPNRRQGPVRFTLQPDSKNWQIVTCDVDFRWSGTLDRIVLRFPQASPRGDLWIDWLEIADGPLRPPPPRPDLISDGVVPRIGLPGLSQKDFADAFRVLDECLIVQVPVFGFPYPVIGPGGKYGENWWQLDASLAVAGAKWANQPFAEDVIRGFRAVQLENPDGRIDLYGGSAVRGQVGDISSLPRFFEAAFDVARRTNDAALASQIYLTMRDYLDWWLSPVKRDHRTGLITAVFEETLGEPDLVKLPPQTIAPVDLNVAVAVGCSYTSELALYLGDAAGRRYRAVFEDLKHAINEYLWDEGQGAYYNYNVKEGRRRLRLISSTFDPMRLGIASPQQSARLLARLLDPAQFNWGKLPVTSLARTEPDYVEATGTYDGRAWLGDVWSLRNLTVIAALEDSGRHDLAAELAWTTIKAFHANYSEYLEPGTGHGQGERRYAWTASQYIQAVIEHLFGIDYDRFRRRLRIVPRIPAELVGQDLTLTNLLLPAQPNCYLSLTVRQAEPGKADVLAAFSGPLPEVSLQVLLPQTAGRTHSVRDAQGRSLPFLGEQDVINGTAGVQIPLSAALTLRFE